MDKVKIRTLAFKEYAAKKPISITPTGKFITPSELTEKATLGVGSLFALNEDLKVKLTVERNKLEPDYKLGIIGVGIVTKDEVIDNVQKGTEFGQQVVNAEMSYCNELMSALAESRPASQLPEAPKARVASIPPDWKWIPKKWWDKWRPYFRMCALFCENTTDSVTQYAAGYRKTNVHPVFAKRGFCLHILEGVNDVRAKFSPLAKSLRVAYISGIGHGSPTVYTGHLGDPILTKCNYDAAEVKGKVIHLLSCQTARELGPDLIRKGARAYAGYYENFTFVSDQQGTPVNEMELFWKCDSTFDIMMALGATVETAHNTTIATYNAAIALVPNTAAATWLTHDRNCFRSPVIDAIYGDKTAKIYPFIRLPLTPFIEVEGLRPELEFELRAR